MPPSGKPDGGKVESLWNYFGITISYGHRYHCGVQIYRNQCCKSDRLIFAFLRPNCDFGIVRKELPTTIQAHRIAVPLSAEVLSHLSAVR